MIQPWIIIFFPKEKFKIKVSNSTLKLLWVGRLLPRKGILLVTEVMSHVKEYADIQLTIVGDGEMRKDLENEIKIKGLINVNYVGAIPYSSVKEYYEKHDLFFFTSLRDSGGIQLVEAMAYGLPIVTLALHGQDLIVNNNVGIKCPVSSPQETVLALKEAILFLHNNRNILEEMSNAAFKHAGQKTWEKQIKMVLTEFY